AHAWIPTQTWANSSDSSTKSTNPWPKNSWRIWHTTQPDAGNARSSASCTPAAQSTSEKPPSSSKSARHTVQTHSKPAATSSTDSNANCQSGNEKPGSKAKPTSQEHRLRDSYDL